MRKIWARIALIAFGFIFGSLLTPAVAQSPEQFPAECSWLHEPDGQITLACDPPSERGWVIRHLEDVEGGTHLHPNLNISGGSNPRGYVVLSPDTGKGSILEDGHKHKLLIVRGQQYGGTEFRIKPRFKRGLVLCNSRGRNCFDLYKTLQRAKGR